MILPLACPAEEHGHPPVLVNVGVTHRAAVHDQRVVEEIAVAVGSVPELFQKWRDSADMVLVEFGKLGDGLRIFAVMGKRVEWGLYSAFRKDCRLTSRASLNEETRVVSVIKAST